MSSKSHIKVLVIRFSSIGDIVLCSPVLRCLKKISGKSVEVHFLTKIQFASFAGNYPYIDKIHTLENDLNKTIAELKPENFDFVLDLHNNLRSFRVKHALGKPSAAFRKLNTKKWLLTNFKIDRLPRIHIVDRLMEAASPLGVTNDGQGLDFFIPDFQQVAVSKFPEAYREGYVAFVIGGTYSTKRLPNDQIVAIIKMLNYPVILLGGPEDKQTGEEIEKLLPGKAYNGCGAFSLNGSASLVEQSAAVISHDTGLMHIAAALHKPVASVWGNTVPELGMYPYYPSYREDIPHKIFEIKNLSCRPCSKIGYKKCPKGHFKCMNEINPKEVAGWINHVVMTQKEVVDTKG